MSEQKKRKTQTISDLKLKRYKELIQDVTKHNELYYNDKPEISDREFDRLLEKIESFEKKYPSFVASNSPTQKIGIEPKFQKLEHKKPMRSLQNSYSIEELHAFRKRIKVEPLEFCAELKLDGVSLSLTYQEGNLTKALTRGNGLVGENVLKSAKNIKGLPHKLKGQFAKSSLLEVRGEVIIPSKDFESINTLQEFSNPRNTAAGTLRHLNDKATKDRKLRFLAYALGEQKALTTDPKTQFEVLTHLSKWGFETLLTFKGPPHLKPCKTKSISKIETLYETIKTKRKSLPFEVDGLVIKVNDLKLQDNLGFTAKYPRWATALKLESLGAFTTLRSVTWQVGRTGVLTPLASLDPVNVNGITIEHVTLHNHHYIETKDIRLNDRVYVERAGDVIPKISHVDIKARVKKNKKIPLPLRCNSCLQKIKKDETFLRCINFECKEKQIQGLCHFVSKKAMNIEGLAEERLRLFYEKKLIKSYIDIYKIQPEQLKALDGFKEKSISNLLANIKSSKTPSLKRFLYSLGILNLGEVAAEMLGKKFGSLSKLLNYYNKLDEKNPESLGIKGIGDILETHLRVFFKNKTNIQLIEELIKLGVKPKIFKEKTKVFLINTDKSINKKENNIEREVKWTTKKWMK